MAAGAVGTTGLADAAVTAAKLGTGAVGTVAILDAAVTAAKLATGAVGTVAILDGAVTAAKMAAAAVGTATIVDAAVTAAKLGASAVGTAAIADASVTAAKLAAGVGSLVGIYDTTLGASAASIDITGIPATYRHLLLVYYIRLDVAVPDQNLWLRFNADATAADYASRILFADASGPRALAEGTIAGSELGYISAASAPANEFGGGLALVPNYANTTNKKVVTGIMFDTNSSQPFLSGGRWTGVAAINQVTILPGSGNLVAGCRVTLYGLN